MQKRTNERNTWFEVLSYLPITLLRMLNEILRILQSLVLLVELNLCITPDRATQTFCNLLVVVKLELYVPVLHKMTSNQSGKRLPFHIATCGN